MAKIAFKSLISLVLFSTFFLHACHKNNDDIIKDVPVNLTIYPSTPAYFKLSIVGGWVYVSGGVKGIIVYRKDQNEFLAYERESTYQPSKGCVIEVDTTNNIICVDPCSKSKFLLTDGSIQQGPAQRNMKKYATSFDGNAVRITN